MGEECYFVVAFDVERYVGEEASAVVEGVGEVANFEDFVASGTFGGEDYSWVATRGGCYFFYVEFFEHFLAACGLLAFGDVGREARDELH